MRSLPIATNNQIILQESFTSLGLSITNGEKGGERRAYTPTPFIGAVFRVNPS